MEKEMSALRYIRKISVNQEMVHNKLLERIKDGSSVLEVGSASGVMTEIMRVEKHCDVSIIELDSEAYDIAIEFANDGFCGNIEEDDWCNHFDGKQYDYIIFCDVLEHLWNPEKTLTRVKKFLKNDGSVLISVPNIAHNSIIIQLINNQFIYQSTGILDYTHIRHFTFSEINKSIEEAGYLPIYYDATYIEVGKNEFDVSYNDINSEIVDILKKRPFGELYQFLFEIKKSEYVKDNDCPIEDCLGGDKLFESTACDEKETINYSKNINRIIDNPNRYFVYNDEISRMRLEINDLYSANEQRLSEKEEEISDLRQIIKNKDGHIELLLESERKFEQFKRTQAYKSLQRRKKIVNRILPRNTKRRFLVATLYYFLKNPRKMRGVITWTRIKKFFNKSNTKDMAQVNERLYELMRDEEKKINPSKNIDVFKMTDNASQKVCTSDQKALYKKLTIPFYKRPLVSVIIPAYNQFDYTYHCIESIIKHSKNVTYEIILADDCSTDLTISIKDIVENIIVARTPNNLKFLLNCNNAATFARGEYILFLNNDTQVQENWLFPLVDLMTKDSSIGMTGSKLLYSDGLLQEAGGIVWQDASAWNYGNRKDPEDPEYNYVREADYISGASIMIRKNLWEEIGGFDEIYAPAYYEDTDLAFEVRKHGYKVVYQPKSVVAHFEGISNGTDISIGIKHNQEINRIKFYEKWKEILVKENFRNGENVFLAKDRSRFKKQILVVDQYVPHYDQDAGGKCTYMYLKMFVKLGLKVTFIGDNYYRHQPYTDDLNKEGIEVLYGNYYYNNWEKWLKENLHYFDFVYLQRPHISVKYIDLVKKYGKGKILYFAHDLHHVREMREYELTGDKEHLIASENWEKMEMDLFSKTDVGHVVGSYEQAIMQGKFPNKPIRNIPLYIYERTLTDINKDFSARQDLLYVGGFGHPPNIDAVLWFGKEVLPKIVEKYPGIKWHVVGSRVTEEIRALASNNIIIEGFLSDAELEKLYRTCRIAVVPLRVGAGVKGKVVEAAYYQIPLVTTSIGAEGLDDKMGNMIVEDGADKFAETICSIYCDYEKLRSMSDTGIKFINDYFVETVAEKVILQDLHL